MTPRRALRIGSRRLRSHHRTRAIRAALVLAALFPLIASPSRAQQPPSNATGNRAENRSESPVSTPRATGRATDSTEFPAAHPAAGPTETATTVPATRPDSSGVFGRLFDTQRRLRADWRITLGGLRLLNDDIAAAEVDFVEALRTLHLSPNVEASREIAAFTGIGCCRRLRGEPVGAAAAYQRAVRAIRRSPLAGSDQAVALYTALGRTLLDMGRAAQAEPGLRGALALARNIYPPDDWRIGDVSAALGRAILAQNRLDDAEPFLRDAFERLRGSAAPIMSIVEAAEEWGAVLNARGMRDQAEPILLEALDNATPESVTLFGRAIYRRTLVRLVELYSAWDHPEQHGWREMLRQFDAGIYRSRPSSADRPPTGEHPPSTEPSSAP